MILTHRDQRGAVGKYDVVQGPTQNRRVAYSRVEDVPVEQEIIQNIAHRSDLTSLCVNFSTGGPSDG